MGDGQRGGAKRHSRRAERRVGPSGPERCPGGEDQPPAQPSGVPPARPSEVLVGAPPARRTAREAEQMSDVEQAVVAGVRDLLPVLRERAQEAEDARDVPAESVKALTEIGFFRLLQPATYG